MRVLTSSANYRHWLDVAKDIQGEISVAGIGSPRLSSEPVQESKQTLLDLYDEAVTSELLRSASRELFADGHYAEAVEGAFKRLNNEVKAKSGLTELDGDRLMRQAFSANGPILHLNPFITSSEKDEQRGYMDIFAGAMTGIRNPRAHEDQIDDQPNVALELLVLANHLMRKLESAAKH